MMATTTPFVWGRGGQPKTQDALDRDRAIAQALMTQGIDTSPVQHWTQGLARMGQALAGRYKESQIADAEKERGIADQALIAQLLGGGAQSAAAEPVLTEAVPGAAPDPVAMVAGAMPQEDMVPVAPAAAPQGMQPMSVAQAPQASPQLGGVNPAIIQAISDPKASPQVRSVAQMLFQQQMAANDPKAALEMENLRSQIATRGIPSSVQEFKYAQDNPGYTDYQLRLKQAGANRTNINLPEGQKAWDIESAKLAAKRYDDITAGAQNASQMLGMYDVAEQALDSGVRTGFGAETELNVRRLGQALGVEGADDPKIAGGELVRAVQNRMALTMRSPDGGMGMPGALSDRDIKFLKDSQVGLDRSPAGNRRMLEAFRAMENRKIEIAKLADDYIARNGRMDPGFNREVREYAKANPLFPGNAAQTKQPTKINGYTIEQVE